jgi:2,4-dienoyl-CoA reductase (NADPH2)
MKYNLLFEPLQISKLKLINRVAMPPMTTNYAKDGFVTDRMIEFYRERARGGAAMIIVEDCIVNSPCGHHSAADILIDDEKYIPDLKRLAKAIQDEGACACLQLNHAGRKAGFLKEGRLALTEGQMPVAPSPLAYPDTGFVVPRELTLEDIEELEDKFATAAWRARECGFDIISFHGTHGYLIEQFLSPFSNKRRDIYGGDAEGRFRFLAEIISKTRQKIGPDFPLMCRISGEELYEENCLTIEDARQNAKRLEAAGIHCLSVSINSTRPGEKPHHLGIPLSSSTSRNPRGDLVHLAAAVKDVVSIPVMTANRIITPALAERILEQGRADIIGIGRGLMADPEWPRKAKEGRESEIRHCISCQWCMTAGSDRKPLLSCTVNPLCGQEDVIKITLANKIKTVFIAGGGPAGMEAARVAALRGHKVRLFEKDTLGGQLNLACVTPGQSDIKMLVDWETGQLKKLGVKIENRELNVKMIQQEKPDAVVVATGALPKENDFPVTSSVHMVTYDKVLKGLTPISPNSKIVIIGGRQIGAETAELLAGKGHDVTLIESSRDIAVELKPVAFSQGLLLLSLKRLGVKIFTGATVEKITKRGVIVRQKSQQLVIPADIIVLALGNKSDRTLADHLSTVDVELHIAGDCSGVGRMTKAVKEGFQAGLAL